ncbi:MAG: PAS domain-containing protein, partial [Saprospiraceae bacterium]
MLCIANTEGYFLDINPAFIKILGYSREELLAKPFLNWVHPDDLQSTLDEIEKLGKGNPAINFKNRYLCSDGNYKWLEWYATPEVESGRLYASARDITSRVEMTWILNDTQKIAKIGGWKLHAKTGKVDWSKQIYEIYGLPEGHENNVEIGISQYHPEDRDKISNAVTNAISKGVSFDLKLRFRRVDGSQIWVRSKGNPVWNDLGEIEAVQGVFQDIDKEEKTRRQLEANEEILKQLIKHTPADVAMFDKEMCYLQHSERWLIDYDLEGQEIIGKSHYEVFPDITEKWKEDHRRVQKGEVLSNPEDYWIRDDGSEVYLNWHLQPWHLANGEIGGIIMFTQVVTDEVKNRLALEESNTDLKQSNLDLEQFAYIASHDLKEPLRMIGNFNQLLSIRYGDKLDDKGRGYLDYSMKSVKKMENLIVNILDFSRVGRQKNSIKKCDITKLITKKIDNLKMLIQEKNAEIITKTMPKEIYCEENQIGLVFYNLINNALKFNKNHA